MKTAAVTTIDQYISDHPKHVQQILQYLRRSIKDLAPQAEEAIKYGIPTLVLKGNLVHFGAYQHHIGFYPGAAGIEEFKKDLVKYKTSKGAIQFPIDEPLPMGLITKIVKFRVAQNLEKSKKK